MKDNMFSSRGAIRLRPDPRYDIAALRHAIQSVFWAAVWLAAGLVAVKAYYLTVPRAVPWADELATPSVRLLAAISYGDLLFVSGLWIAGRAALALAGPRRLATRTITIAFITSAALACLYAVASIIVYDVLGGFLTYHLLALVGDVGMLRSSVAAYLTLPVAVGLVSVPLCYIALVLITARGKGAWRGAEWPRRAVALAGLSAWLIFGHYAFAADWATRQERAIASNPHWVLASSWWRAVTGGRTVQVGERFAAADLSDFTPIGPAGPP